MTADSRGRQRQHAILLARFLETELPIQAIATLTSPVPRSLQVFDTVFKELIAEIQRHSRITVGWIRADELSPQRHIHVALVACRPPDCLHARQVWQSKV